jgi:uncharacterized protein YcbK (DUF882 family)
LEVSVSMQRRQILAGALGIVGAGFFGAAAKATAMPRSLSLLNLHTGETLNATYFEDGAYLPDALSALNHLLRDFRTGDVHPIAPGLLDLVSTLSAKLDSREAVQIISGYRSPATNAALHEHSAGVASHSLHIQGMAVDIRIPGVQLAQVRDTALSLGRGGVGFYPGSDFVHVDVGRVRRW